jgi:AcrR family transcriptional regulator
MEGDCNILEKIKFLFLRYGIKSLTMDDVAKELGISKKTLYQHVANKAELIEKVMIYHIDNEKHAMQCIRGQAGNAIEEMMLIAEYVMGIFQKIAPTLILDLQKHYTASWNLMQSLHRKHIYEVISKNILWGIEQGLYRKDLDHETISRLYVAQAKAMVDEDIFPRELFFKDEIFRTFIRYHLHGIASMRGLEMLNDKLVA